MKITVAGSGYVSVSNAVLLAQHNDVVAIDIIPAKVAMLNARQSPIEDPELEHYLASNPGAMMVIKSTVPVGYTASLRRQTGCANIIFSPEILCRRNTQKAPCAFWARLGRGPDPAGRHPSPGDEGRLRQLQGQQQQD